VIGSLEFGAPGVLLALALVPLVAAALWRGEQRRAAADRALGGAPALRLGRSRWRRWLRAALLLGALAAIVLAAARPQWGEEQRAVAQRGIDVAIALDVSRSMTATDVEPSRARAAAAALEELLASMSGDRAALVTFAGSALVRSPLTRDLGALAQLVARAQAEAALTRPGSNLGVALQRALDALNVEEPARTQVIVIVSDGEDPSERRIVDFAVETAADRGVRVYAAVAGTPGGGELPDAQLPGGGTEVSVADPGLLAGAAAETGGEFRSLASLPGLAVTFRRLQQTRFAEEEESAPIERFQWFGGVALALLAVHTLVAEGGRRRPLGRVRPRLLSTPATVLLASVGALLLAACGGSAAYEETRAGSEAYDAGRYEEALERYDAAADADPPPADLATLAYDRGNALHRLERYDEATDAAAQAANETEDLALAAEAAYALGSHAFRAGRLEAAREAFVTALLRDPEDADARANLEIVLRVLAPPDEAPPGPADPSPSDSDPEPGEPDGDAADGDPPDGDAGAGPPGGDPTAAPPGQQPGGDPVPGAGVPGDSASPADPAASGAQSAEEARAALEAALSELESGEIPLEEALRILDLVRQLDALAALGEPPSSGRPLPPR
jgi:Ca-activated chloride channel family protein